MPFLSFLSSSKKVTRYLMLVLIGAIPIAAHQWYTHSLAAPPPHSLSVRTSGAAVAVPTERRRKVISLKLTRQGFAPVSLAAPKGEYFLTVHTGTGLDDLDLRLDRESGQRMKSGRLSRETLRWNEYVELHPGNYVLAEASHPAWSCRITISPNDE